MLDTDVSSAILRDRLPDSMAARLTGQTLVVTFVTVGELTKWTELRSWGPRRLSGLASFYERVGVLQYTPAVARCWGRLQARAERRGRPRPVNDSWIAACCLDRALPLATWNRKDFVDFAEQEGLRLLADEG